MSDITVPSTDFQRKAGLYMEQSAKKPIFITKHKRPVRVLLDIDEYERLKARDTRQALAVEDLPEEWVEGLEKVQLDHLPD